MSTVKCYNFLCLSATNGGSSNGRTGGFGPAYWGSNPYPPASVFVVIAPLTQANYFAIKIMYNFRMADIGQTNVTLVQTETADKLVLNGILSIPNKNSKNIVLHIHGTSGSFYWNSFYSYLSKMSVDLGLTFLATNNRGSGVYEVEKGTVYHGASLEKFEDCLLDIDAWIEFCLSKGYTNIILEGHSFGTEKSVYYLVKGKYKDKIKAVILLGFSDTVGTQRSYEKKIGKNYFEEANKLVGENRGEYLLADLGALCGELPISAQTYLNYFSENSACSMALPLRNGRDLKYFQKITVPILGVIGDKDDGEYTIIPINDAIKLLNSENIHAEAYKIKDCNHGFDGKEVELAKIVETFLTQKILTLE